MDDFDALVAEYLEGRLDEAGIERLSERVRGDEALRDRFLDLAGVEGLLRAELAPSDLHDELVRRITLCLVGRDQEERTAERVLERIQDRTGCAPERPGDVARMTARSISRRRLMAVPAAHPASIWTFVALAAGLLIAVAALLFLAPAGAPREHGTDSRVARGPEPALAATDRVPDPTPPHVDPALAPDAGREERVPGDAASASTAPATIPGAPAQTGDRTVIAPRPETPTPVAPGTQAPVQDRPLTAPRTAVVPAKDSAAIVARLESLSGEIKVTGHSGIANGRVGLGLIGGQGVLTGGGSGALVRYPDGTSLVLGPETEVREIADADAGPGKRLVVARGMLSADVARQPPDRPMVLTTPHGEARVLGTSFRLVVDAEASGSTRLEVRSGKVRLTRARDGKSVEVPAGFYAELVPGGDLAGSRRVVTISFQDGVAPVSQYEGTRDAYIAEHRSIAPKIPGMSTILVADGDSADSGQPGMDRSALIRWDLTAIPRGATVVWAEIGIQVVNDSGGRPFGIYELKREWAESHVTWTGPTSLVPWQKPGAQGEQDRGAPPLGAMAPSVAGPYSVPLTRAGLSALQTWVSNPVVNHGLIIADTENGDALIFKSRKATPPAERPRLTVSVVSR